MLPKWIKKADFGDSSNNVFNRRKFSYLIIETLHFNISFWVYNFSESNHRKLIFFCIFSQYFQKNPSSRIWCYRIHKNYQCVIPDNAVVVQLKSSVKLVSLF